MTLTPSKFSVFRTGEKAPEFELKGVDGKTYSLSEFKGTKAVLIIFMCNHCPYVTPKIPYFIELQEKYVSQGLQVIGISSNDPEYEPFDSFENMKEIAIQKKFNFPYLYDETQDVALAFGAECTPDPFLLDKELRLAYHGRFDNAHGEPHSKAKTSEMETAIKQLLENKKITVPALPSMGCNIKWKPGKH